MRQLLLLILLFLNLAVKAQDTVAQESYFSSQGGVYLDTVQLELKGLGDRIYYTTDGSFPSSGSKKYSKPILITKTTVVRAVEYVNGAAGDVETQTFFIGREYDMAVVSIAVNPDDFFGFERGIYVKGCCADSVPPYRGANFWKGWERKINIEFYESDGSIAFNQLAGARIFGGFSKGLPMKSLAIIARKKYGEKRFRYQIFPNKDIKKFKSFILRSSGSDFNKAHFRDALLTNLVEPLDIEIQAYRPAAVYINGTYWGIHNVREKINEEFLKGNNNANPDSVDIMKHRNDLQVGNRKHYLKMKKYMEKTDFSDATAMQHLDSLMDIDNYINYNQAEIYIDNRDAGGNIRFWRPQTKDGRWRWILFDTDISFGITDWKAYKKNTLHKMTNKNKEKWPDPAWSTFIIRQLLENDSIKNLYINRFADHLNTIFSSKNVIFKIDSIQDLLRKEMAFHVKRWRSNNMERWERNIQVMRDFATHRPFYMRQHLMEKFNLTDTFNVEVKNPNPDFGSIKLNSIEVNNGFKGIYFGGVPIHILPIPAEGYVFDGWETPVEEWQELKGDLVLSPIFKKASKSKYWNKVMLSEISVKQDSASNSGDWLEFYNISHKDIDLSGWQLRSKKGSFEFSENTTLAPGEFLVLCRYPSLFGQVYKEVDYYHSDSISFGFSSKKDRIILIDNNQDVVDSIVYSIKNDFPELVETDLKVFESNLGSAAKLKNWTVTNKISPGKMNSSYIPPIPESDVKNASSLLLYIGGGVLLIGFGLLMLFLSKKKKQSPDKT